MLERALFCGAGISGGPPASLPLGRELDERLSRCFFEAAARVVGGAATVRGLASVDDLRVNRIALVAGVAGPPIAADLLRRFRVTVPNEAHLLAAVHAARGSFVLTTNFDDGIETAYALIEGRIQLPLDAPEMYRAALDAWRAAVRPIAPLHVVASRFSNAEYGSWPTLVKLRGSTQEGWDSSLVPEKTTSEPAGRMFAEGQMFALRRAAAAERFAVAGVSGADAYSQTALLKVLRPGHFSWTSAAMDEETVAAVRRLDVSQPVLKRAVEGVRASLPNAEDLPPWPEGPPYSPGFDVGFAEWEAHLPVTAAAEVYVQLLSEAGLADQASVIQSALERARYR